MTTGRINQVTVVRVQRRTHRRRDRPTQRVVTTATTRRLYAS